MGGTKIADFADFQESAPTARRADFLETRNPHFGPSHYTTTYAEEKVLPVIIPVCIEGEILWAYLDTGSGRNFISREAVKKLKLKPARHESREILTVN